MITNLKDMDFFALRLLADKKGTFYVRDGEIFVYQGAIRIEIDPEDGSATSLPGIEADPTGQKMTHGKIGSVEFETLNPSKNIKLDGYFWFWQHDEYFVLVFVHNARQFKPLLLRAGKATDSL